MKGAMSRNLYLLAASLLLFSLISCGMSLVPNSLQPGLPVNGSLWKTIGLVFLSALPPLRSGRDVDRHVRASGAQERGTHAAGAAGRPRPPGPQQRRK